MATPFAAMLDAMTRQRGVTAAPSFMNFEADLNRNLAALFGRGEVM